MKKTPFNSSVNLSATNQTGQLKSIKVKVLSFLGNLAVDGELEKGFRSLLTMKLGRRTLIALLIIPIIVIGPGFISNYLFNRSLQKIKPNDPIQNVTNLLGEPDNIVRWYSRKNNALPAYWYMYKAPPYTWLFSLFGGNYYQTVEVGFDDDDKVYHIGYRP